MTKVFISYSTKDESIAQSIYTELSQVGADPFLSSISIKPGTIWADEIDKNLNMAKRVIFIATKSSCASSNVQREIGVSLNQNKQIIPILIDITPEELPGEVSKHQAIDARDVEHLQKTIKAIGRQCVKEDKLSGLMLVGLVVALLAFVSK